MRLTSLLFVLLISVALSGCAWQGNEIDTNFVKKIENGTTTEREIVMVLGKPTVASLKPDNEEKIAYIYTYTQIKGKAVVCSILGGEYCLKSNNFSTDTQILEIWVDSTSRIVKRHTFRVQ